MASGGQGYMALKAIWDAQRVDNAEYWATPPDACPYDGTPLVLGWQTRPGGGRELLRDCPCGDYAWRGGRRLT